MATWPAFGAVVTFCRTVTFDSIQKAGRADRWDIIPSIRIRRYLVSVRSLLFLLLLGLGFAAPGPPAKKLLVVSVDGLDQRYLRDRDRLGLRIPNMRRREDVICLLLGGSS